MTISESGGWRTNSGLLRKDLPELAISRGRLGSCTQIAGIRRARKRCEGIYRCGKEDVHAFGAPLTASL